VYIARDDLAPALDATTTSLRAGANSTTALTLTVTATLDEVRCHGASAWWMSDAPLSSSTSLVRSHAASRVVSGVSLSLLSVRHLRESGAGGWVESLSQLALSLSVSLSLSLRRLRVRGAQANAAVYYCGENSNTSAYWTCPRGLPGTTAAMVSLAGAAADLEKHAGRVTTRFHRAFDVLSVFLLACALLLLILVLTGLLGSITRSQV
jgi:hypothetical protein